ncbi:MAG: hypothetical protein JKY13_03725, partial [Gammaproteobacteria bacterium]|nr:hypothetical protein [Gammaproteobacteria bacterium]
MNFNELESWVNSNITVDDYLLLSSEVIDENSTVNADTFASYNALLHAFSAEKVIAIQVISNQLDSTADKVHIIGTSVVRSGSAGDNDSVLFNGMAISIKFFLSNDAVHFELIATVNDTNWTLQDSFPLLTGGIFAQMSFSHLSFLPSLYLGTSTNNSNLKFSGDVSLTSLNLPFDFVDSFATFSASGNIRMVGEHPEIALYSTYDNLISWQLGFGISIQRIWLDIFNKVDFNIAYYEYEASDYFGFETVIEIPSQTASADITLLGNLDINNGNFVLWADINEALPMLVDEFSHFLQMDSLHTVFPSHFNLGTSIQLSELKFFGGFFTGSLPKLTEVRATIDIAAQLTLLQSPKIVLNDVQIHTRFSIGDNASRNFTYTLAGYFLIGEEQHEIEVIASGPDWDFYCSSDDAIKVNNFLKFAYGQQDNAMNELDIDDFSLAVHPSNHSYTLDSKLSGDWTLVSINDIALRFEQGTIAITHDTQNKTTVDLSLGLYFNDLACNVAATYTSLNRGWDFRGTLAEGETIALGGLLQNLADTFQTGIHLPTVLQRLTVGDVVLEFNTVTKDFHFAFDSQWQLASTSLVTHLDVTMSQGDGEFHKQYSGHLDVDVSGQALQFDMLFDDSHQGNTFMASYHQQGGQTFKIHDIVNNFSSSAAVYVPESLSVTLNDMLFIYDNDNNNNKKLLLATEIGGGVDLADLPLVGRFFSHDESLRLAMQMVVASGSFAKADIERFNGLLPSDVTALPSEKDDGGTITPGLHLFPHLQLSDITLDLSLPIKAEEVDDGTGTDTMKTQISHDSDHLQAKKADDVIWLDVQRHLGPVHLQRIGVKYHASKSQLDFILDGSLSLAGLTIALEGLQLSTPLTAFDPSVSLHGLGIFYEQGPLAFGGELLKNAE